MAKIHVDRTKAILKRLYDNRIDLSDYSTRPPEEKERAFFTRALTAYTVKVLANSVDDELAIKSVVDGFDDNGIDGVYFDSVGKRLWLIQSKWIEKGNGEPETGETLKFTQGVRDLIEFNLDRFNDRIQQKARDIEAALYDSATKIQLVLAYTGQGFSKHNDRIIADLMLELNDPVEIAQFRTFPLSDIYRTLNGVLDGQPIKEDIVLTDWGKVDEPYSAYYGKISAADIAQWWNRHRGKLFSENIRSFVGATDINRGIMDTLTNEPENFLYFNNGITVLCSTFNKKLIGGNERTTGTFECDGLSIVNGAQTVGSIGEAYEKAPDTVARAQVFVKFISLKDCPPDISIRITKATNTQNRVEKVDFISLDPEQERIRAELDVECSVKYYYQRTSEMVSSEATCTAEEAAIAIACSDSEIDLAVTAKRETGKLWDDTQKEPYTKIFNAELKAIRLWRVVQISRVLQRMLEIKASSTTGRERGICVHGNRFMAHLLFQQISLQVINDPAYDFANYTQNDLPSTIDRIRTITVSEVERMFPTSLVHQLFRTFTKCRDLKIAVVQRL